MTSSAPTIFVLDKQNYSKHRLVTLPNDSKSSLAPSSIRFRSKVLGLTTNNLTYARLGAFMGWYDIFPLPPNTPEPFSDTATYGRTSAWGYAEIVESTVDGISAGQTIFGYLPISTDTETLLCEYAEHNGEKIPDQIVILDEHRQHLWKVYNRYQVCPPLAELEKTAGWDSIGFDALMQVLYGTSYWLNRHGLAWTDEDRIHPTGEGEWTAEDADLRGATVVILNASGKTGMSFAYALRENRPTEHHPKTIIGVGSQNSVGTIEKSGLYDQAELNSDAQRIASEIEKSGPKRVVLVDFGARVGANKDWRAALEAQSVPFTLLTVGGEVEVQNHEKALARLGEMASLCIINASKLREKSIEVGGDRYIKEFLQAWEEFKGKQKMMTLQWGEGLEEFEKGWKDFCEDKVPASVGKVYRL